jgi:hypothetical protein
MSLGCMPAPRADGLSQRQLNQRREWLQTAIGVEAASRGEAWEALYEQWSGDHTGRGWVDLVDWFNDAAGPLNSALIRFDSPDVDMILTVESYVNSIYGHFMRERELPSRTQLLKLAEQAVTE